MSAPDGRALASRLSSKARSDEVVLERLMDDPTVPDDVLGFHAQQAVEKLLKAALAAHGAVPPRTHDLGRLARLAADDGLVLPDAAREADRLGAWAVEFRYADPLDEALDREWALRVVADVREWLDALLAALDSS